MSRALNRPFPLRVVSRCKNSEIFDIGVPSAAILVAGNEDADGIHVLGFDLGTCCVPVHPKRVDRGLQLPAPKDLHPRKVRLRPLFYFQGSGHDFDRLSSSLTSVLSINAAISASVVLASRLPDDISVFALMLYAVVLFAMFPVLRHRLQVRAFLGCPSGITSMEKGAEPVVFITEAQHMEYG